MKNIFWIALGVAAGFVAAHQVNKSQKGQQFFANVDAKVRDFSEAVSDGYHSKGAQLREETETL